VVSVSEGTSRPSAEMVTAVADRFREAGISCDISTPETQSRHVGEAIVDEAQRFNPDLLVMGSRGYGDFESLVRGSESHRVLSGVTCPVLLGRAAATRPSTGRLLLAIGGQESDARTIADAMGVARAAGKKLIVLHVVRTLSDVITSPYLDPIQAEVELLDPVVEALRDSGLAADGVVTPGGAAEEITKLARAHDVDLIVIGHGPRSDLGGLLSGDVRAAVIHLSDRPVLVSPGRLGQVAQEVA